MIRFDAEEFFLEHIAKREARPDFKSWKKDPRLMLNSKILTKLEELVHEETVEQTALMTQGMDGEPKTYKCRILNKDKAHLFMFKLTDPLIIYNEKEIPFEKICDKDGSAKKTDRYKR